MQLGNGVAAVGMGTSLLPSSCLQAPEFLGAASSSVPQVECVCASLLPPALGCREKSAQEGFGGEK